MSSKNKIKVKIIGEDNYVKNFFRMYGDHKYSLLIDDIHSEPDIIVFTGGSDIDPSLYNEKPLRVTHSNPERDSRECKQYERYLDKFKIGICRGGQLLNVLSGGSMWQDVDNHHCSHEVINFLNIKNSLMMGEEIRVTSDHHQMMIPGPDAEIIAAAFDKDGHLGRATRYLSGDENNKNRIRMKYDPEVIWYESTRSLCFQPHPEYLGNDGKSTREYFFKLLDFLY